MMNRHNGFTLIELMVTVAMVAILASIAIPSYRQYAIRNAESQAQAKMKQLEIELNRWRATALTYKGFLPKKIANDGTVSYSYDTGASDDVANTVIYVPANSTAAKIPIIAITIINSIRVKPFCIVFINILHKCLLI